MVERREEVLGNEPSLFDTRNKRVTGGWGDILIVGGWAQSRLIHIYTMQTFIKHNETTNTITVLELLPSFETDASVFKPQETAYLCQPSSTRNKFHTLTDVYPNALKIRSVISVTPVR